MNKTILALAALPVVFGAAGFGAGKVFAPASATAAAPLEATHAVERSDAEKTLDRLADEEDSHGKPEAHAPAAHEAKLIPAKATAPVAKKAESHAVKAPAPAAKPAVQQKASAVKAEPARAPGDLSVPKKGMMTDAQLKDSKVVKLGRVTVPVHRANSITYVVTDIGVSVADIETAAHYNVAENATRLRDAIIQSMHRAAGTTTMRSASINTEVLSETLSADLKHDFGDKMGEVLFLSLFKADVPRS